MSKNANRDVLISDNKGNALALSAIDKKVEKNSDKREIEISKLILINKDNALALFDANKIINRQKRDIKNSEAVINLANKEKAKQEAELLLANKELTHQAELIILNKKLLLANKHEKFAKKKFIDLYNFAPSGYFTLSREGKFMELNPYVSTLIGKSHRSLLGKQFSGFISPDEKPVFTLFFEKIFSTQIKESCEVTLAVNGGLPVHVHIIGIASRNSEECLINIIDITKRKLADEALRVSEEKYRLLISNMKDVVYSVDIATKEFIYLSPSFEKLTGYTSEDIYEMGGRVKFLNEVVEMGKVTEWENYILGLNITHSHVDFNYETLWLCKDGTYKYLNDRWIPIFVNGKLSSTNGILTDITKRMKAEEELRGKIIELTNLNAELEQYTYANQELKQFAYIASHQIQEPIRTVSNFTQILEEDYSLLLDENGFKHLHIIRDATQRMALLINSLLEFSQLGRNKKLIFVDCSKLIYSVIDDIEGLISASNTIIDIGEMPILNLYEVEIRQLFQNLIINAIKFQDKDTQPIIRIRSEKLDDKWKFSVSDNGIGISSVYFDQIFDIFQRIHDEEEKYEGKGIGLAYCKKIVQLHFGDIWVESIVGEGSTFYFTISDMH